MVGAGERDFIEGWPPVITGAVPHPAVERREKLRHHLVEE
jgi:hypothetical protein